MSSTSAVLENFGTIFLRKHKKICFFAIRTCLLFVFNHTKDNTWLSMILEKTRTKVVHNNVNQGCNSITRTESKPKKS